MEKFKFNYLIFPMARISNYAEIKNYKNLDYSEEPQIGFHINSDQIFNNNFVYGARPKIEILQRIMMNGIHNTLKSNIPNFLYEHTLEKQVHINYLLQLV